jgi:hypothetical protein
MSLAERYSSFDSSSDLGGNGVDTTISDTYTTYNQFFGGQLGTELMYKAGRFGVSIIGKIAVGDTYQTLKISGRTVQTDQTTGIVTDAQNEGLFAQPSNVGTYRTNVISVLSETGVKLSFDVSDRIRFTAGYSYLYFSNALRPGDQINRSVTIQPLGLNGLLPSTTPGPITFQRTFFDAQMVNLGLEFLF